MLALNLTLMHEAERSYPQLSRFDESSPLHGALARLSVTCRVNEQELPSSCLQFSINLPYFSQNAPWTPLIPTEILPNGSTPNANSTATAATLSVSSEEEEQEEQPSESIDLSSFSSNWLTAPHMCLQNISTGVADVVGVPLAGRSSHRVSIEMSTRATEAVCRFVVPAPLEMQIAVRGTAHAANASVWVNGERLVQSVPSSRAFADRSNVSLASFRLNFDKSANMSMQHGAYQLHLLTTLPQNTTVGQLMSNGSVTPLPVAFIAAAALQAGAFLSGNGWSCAFVLSGTQLVRTYQIHKKPVSILLVC